MTPSEVASVGFVELYRQWPGYFCDSFSAAQAGDLRRAGHRVGLFKAYLHADSDGGIRALLAAIARDGPWDLLVVERVWSRDLLQRLRAAAGDARVLVNQWESPAQWPEVDYRAAPLSRDAVLAVAGALGRGELPDPAHVPNLWARDDSGRWQPPASALPLRVAHELGAPLDLAYDLAEVIGLPVAEAASTRYLVLNMGCPYRTADNPSDWLSGLDLPTDWGDRGCTFCNVGPYEAQTPALRRELMALQLRELARHGPYQRLVVQDEYIFRDLDQLVELALAHCPPGVDLMVRARVDYLQRCESTLVSALEALGDHGTITPYLIGFESFSDPELRRYNKGQTAAEAEAAVHHLDRLQARHPNLRVSHSMGFILFGPWTTLDDLEANAQAIRRLDFRRFRGGLTRSKLRLNPDAALVARARADGLLLEQHTRPDEDGAATTGYQAEIPYRFMHPEVARVWELLNGPAPIAGRSEVDRLERAIASVRAQ